MQPDKQVDSIDNKQKLALELAEFGFDMAYVNKALQITLDKEKAAQIVMKLVEEGPNTDLSMYQPIPQIGDLEMHTKITELQKHQKIKPIRAKMLFITNGSLKMGKGKICAQVGHGVIGGYLQIQQTAKYDERNRLRLHSWQNSGGAKIVVKAKNLEQMLQIKQKLQKLEIGINMYMVQDAGHTQIKSGSKTILAIGPAFSNEIDPITEHLKLL